MTTLTRRFGSWTCDLLKKRGAELCLGLMILALLVLHGTEPPTRKPPEIESWEELAPLDERHDLHSPPSDGPPGRSEHDPVTPGVVAPPNPAESQTPPTGTRGRRE